MKLGTDFTEGPIFKKYIKFIVPIILSSFLQQLYNTADTMVVGKFAGETALAAVGSTVALTNLILNLFLGLAIGANVVCAQLYGAGNKQGLQRAIHTSYVLAIGSGILLAIVGWFFSGRFLSLMSTPEGEVHQMATLYMRVFFLGSPASLIYNFGATILGAAGDTKRPLYILAVAGIANVVLNLFCVLVLELGVVGVAIGTIASQFISAVWVTVILIKTETEFKLKLSKIKLHFRELKRIIATGIPAGISGMMFSLSNVIIQTAINLKGEAAIAGNVAASNVEIFGFLVLSAAEQGTVSFAAQNFGAKKLDRVDKITKVSMLTALAGAAIFAMIILVAGPVLLGFFTDAGPQSEIIRIGMIKMTIIMYSYILHTPSTILGGVMKGIGKAFVVTTINVLFICILRVLWIWYVYPLNPTLEMIFYSYPVTWGTSSVAAIVVYIFLRRKVFREVQYYKSLE